MRRRLVRAAAVTVGGVALAQAYPPLDWQWLAWCALVPFLLVALATGPRAALGWGCLGGFAFFLPLLRWLNFTFSTYSAIPWPLTWGPTSLLAAYCGLWFGLVTAAVSFVARRRGAAPALAMVPFFWVAAEWIRSVLFSGFPWGLLGYSQYLQLPVIQIAELGGVWAVSFVVALMNAALAAVVALPLRRGLAGLAVGVIVVGASLGFGAARLRAPVSGETFTISVMQPSIPQPLKWDERFAESTLRTYFGLSGQLRRGESQLLVWPETSAPTVLRRDPVLTAAVIGLSREIGAPVLVGSVDVEGGRPPTLRNTVFLLDERGVVGRYDKIHLVPFGEYVPLAGIIGFVRGWAEFISELEPGAAAVVFPGPPAPFGVVICYEGIFPGLVRDFVKDGARLMINMTNDAWFGLTAGPLQHLAMYPLRAVEHRVALARSANTGVSAFIAPTGRIVRRLPLFERGLITERLPLRSVTTLYTRFGDWLAYLGLGVSAAALALAARPANLSRDSRSATGSPRRAERGGSGGHVGAPGSK
ncbi:MAG: apolipoprotein N-acyltransferase [Candidatus Rokubacteria bacterium]|nr:apolipoprotein N-acyltransferase [Candidatus Rokubacteria bacterium]